MARGDNPVLLGDGARGADLRWLDFEAVGAALFGAAIAVVAVVAITAVRGSPAPALAAAFVGGAVGFVATELYRKGPFSPALFFIVGLAFYHIVIPIEYLIDPKWPVAMLHEYPELNEERLIGPLVAANLGLLGFIVGYGVKRPIGRRAIVAMDERRVLAACAGVFGVGLALYLAMSYVATGSPFQIFFTTYRERDELFYGLGALGFGIEFVKVGVICGAITLLARPSLGRTLGALALIGMMAVHAFLIGTKTYVFHVGIGVLIGAHTMGRRLSPGLLVTIVLLFAVPVALVNLARNRQGEGFAAMSEFVREEGSSEDFNPANNDAYGPYLTLVHTMATLRVPDDLRFGSTYAQILTLLPPRFLYPTRPMPIEDEFAQDYAGSAYYEGAGFGFSGLAEAYLNFGYPGVLVVFLVFGVLVAALRDWLERHRGTLAGAFIFGTAGAWIMLCLRSPVSSIPKGYGLFTLAPTILILQLGRKRAMPGRLRP